MKPLPRLTRPLSLRDPIWVAFAGLAILAAIAALALPALALLIAVLA